jgi:hypothetical protein
MGLKCNKLKRIKEQHLSVTSGEVERPEINILIENIFPGEFVIQINY